MAIPCNANSHDIHIIMKSLILCCIRVLHFLFVGVPAMGKIKAYESKCYQHSYLPGALVLRWELNSVFTSLMENADHISALII